jgi:hypothetical protein
METLTYAVDLENKDFLGTEIDDQQLNSLLKDSAHEELGGKANTVLKKEEPEHVIDFD